MASPAGLWAPQMGRWPESGCLLLPLLRLSPPLQQVPRVPSPPHHTHTHTRACTRMYTHTHTGTPHRKGEAANFSQVKLGRFPWLAGQRASGSPGTGWGFLERIGPSCLLGGPLAAPQLHQVAPLWGLVCRLQRPRPPCAFPEGAVRGAPEGAGRSSLGQGSVQVRSLGLGSREPQTGGWRTGNHRPTLPPPPPQVPGPETAEKGTWSFLVLLSTPSCLPAQGSCSRTPPCPHPTQGHPLWGEPGAPTCPDPPRPSWPPWPLALASPPLGALGPQMDPPTRTHTLGESLPQGSVPSSAPPPQRLCPAPAAPQVAQDAVPGPFPGRAAGLPAAETSPAEEGEGRRKRWGSRSGRRGCSCQDNE